MTDDQRLAELLTRLVEGMREYMKDRDVGYTPSEIAECASILEDHATSVRDAPDQRVALEHVRATVMRLNSLNERCGGGLIETDQREDICAFVARVGYLRGFNQENEDVTEPWRDW
jgi:hypothetical protein